MKLPHLEPVKMKHSLSIGLLRYVDIDDENEVTIRDEMNIVKCAIFIATWWVKFCDQIPPSTRPFNVRLHWNLLTAKFTSAVTGILWLQTRCRSLTFVDGTCVVMTILYDHLKLRSHWQRTVKQPQDLLLLLPLLPLLPLPLLLQPFYGYLDFVWDYLGEPVPER